MKNDINIEVLAQQYIDAKKAEDAAIATRRSIGKMIEDALPGPDEGTARSTIPGISITVTRKVTHKIDSDQLQKDWEFIGENVQKAFRWSADLNTKHYRALQELGTAELEAANKYVTSKPAAASVAVLTDKE